MDQLHVDISKAVDEKKDEIITTLRELVRIPSVTGEEGPAQEYVEKIFRNAGLEVSLSKASIENLKNHPAFIQMPWGYDKRPNVIGVLKSSAGGKDLILNTHVDVVSAEPVSAWKYDPWEGKVEDGRLYGRGALDAKCGIVEMLYAIGVLKELGIRPKGNVVLESVIEEEAGGPGGTLATILSGYTAKAAIVLEPFLLYSAGIGSAGVRWFRVRVTGKTEHAGRAHLGINAIGKIMELYRALEELDRQRGQTVHFALAEKRFPGGRSTNLSIGKVQGGDWPSTVAGWAVLEGRIGWQPNEKMKDVENQVEAAVKRVAEKDPWMREHPPTVEWFGWNAEASYGTPDDKIVKTIQKNARQVIGKEPEPVGTTAANDSRHYRLSAKMPAVLYGPRGSGMHGLDEYVELNDVFSVTKIIAFTILDWCGYEIST